ncbi:MAG: hypothetical protein ACJATF_004440 [Flavobacteriales bacterium]|jgi:hypothetical protein
MVVVLYQCTGDKKSASSSADQSTTALQSGEELAKIYCASCHLYPTPDLLDKKTWTNFVLIRMGSFMGIYQNANGSGYVSTISDQWLEPGVGGQGVKAANVYPNQAIVTIPEWEKIIDFYIKNAPDQLPKVQMKVIKVGIPFFKSRRFNQQKNLVPLVQSMAVDEVNKVVYAAEYKGGIYKFDNKGKQLGEFKAKGHIVEMKATKDEFLFLDMASRYASDDPKGAFYTAKSFEDLTKKRIEISANKLMRPVDFSIGDLTGNQKEDGNYERHEIFKDDGTIKSEITDLNNDGKNDIIALKGNSGEGIDWYLNEGDGNFKRERKLHFPPTNGSTHFQLIDFDKDGVEDLLYSNGDNGDDTPIVKPYHGIHFFLNKNGEYKEEFFIPLNGASIKQKPLILI